MAPPASPPRRPCDSRGHCNPETADIGLWLFKRGIRNETLVKGTEDLNMVFVGKHSTFLLIVV